MSRLQHLLDHYLLISLTLAFACGIFLHHLLPLQAPICLFISLSLLLPALLCRWKGKTRRASRFLLPIVITLGLLHSANFTSRSLQETNISSRIVQEEECVLTGTLHSMVQFDGRKNNITVKSKSLRLEHEDFFTPVHGLVRLRLKGIWPESLLPGDELVIRATLYPPYRFGNPGGFDYPAYLETKNIRRVGSIGSIAHIHPLEYDANLFRSLRYLPERIRSQLRDIIDDTLLPQQAGIYRALLIGDRTGVDSEILEAFKASGTMHILAISGLHLSLVATGLFLLFYWLTRCSQYLLLRTSCKKLALLATIPPLFAYALLAGAQTPVLRSLIMVLVFILAFCTQRQRSPFTTLSFAALLILLINPLSLLSVSFQLSFSAVASLILILPKLQSLLRVDSEKIDKRVPIHLLSKGGRWLTAALLVSIAATIGTAPLLVHSFNRLSTVGPVANLLMEPLLCLWSLPFGLLAIPFLFISPLYSAFLLKTGAMGINGALTVATFFAEYDLSTLWLPTPSITLVLLYYLSLGLCLSGFPRKKTLPLFLLVCLLFAFPPQALLRKTFSASELVFLDVGQGSSTLITFPGGKTILIDGGGVSSPRFNTGESIIAPYLWHRGITHLDAVVVTHPDTDHYNGIPFLLKRFHPDTLWVNGEQGHEPGYMALLDLAHDLGVRIAVPQKNEILLEERGATLRNVDNPFLGEKGMHQTNATSHANDNDKSLILHFAHAEQKVSCLFPGDISHRVEAAIVSSGSRLQSTFLLAAHHGSGTSNSPQFLDWIKPEQIVVSAGRFRPLHFPSLQLQSYCRKNNIPLLNTAEIGAVTLRTTDVGINLDTFKNPHLISSH